MDGGPERGRRGEAAVGSRTVRTLATLVGAVVVLAVLVGGAVLAWRALEPPALVAVERCSATVDGVEHPYDPDQAATAALVAGVGRSRALPPRAVTIALATAVQESRLRNISYGDRDSLGVFQQRPSQGWGTPEQVQDPLYATNAFYDRLLAVAGYQDLPVTVAAQEVQRSGFPEAYGDHEGEARAWASALTGYSPAALTCRLRAPDDASVQTIGADGLWPRAAAVRERAAAELPGVAVAPGPPAVGSDNTGSPTDGRTVLVGTAGDGEEAQRTAWADAAWAVANARDLGITEVAVDGRTWRRGRPDDGWVATAGAVAGGGGALADPPAGVAAVRVAG